jgi:hypothetical protein
VIRQDSATVDAYWPPEWQVEHNIFHFPVVCQPIVAAYNLGPDAPPNNQTLVWPPHYTHDFALHSLRLMPRALF